LPCDGLVTGVFPKPLPLPLGVPPPPPPEPPLKTAGLIGAGPTPIPAPPPDDVISRGVPKKRLELLPCAILAPPAPIVIV
jgi:hypothetical protein